MAHIYRVYTAAGKEIASYGLGWNIAEIFRGTAGAYRVTLFFDGTKELSTVTITDLKILLQ